MGDAKQSHLNGAYYGPSIPPPSKSYHRPGRSGSSCNPLSCLCGCVFSLILKIVLTIIFIAGLAVLVFWLIYRPNRIKFYVTDATLTQFDLNTTTNNLYYNLNLNLTIRNPNKHIGVYYDRIEARAYYEDQRFGVTPLPNFYQGTKNTTDLSFGFTGQNMVVLKDSGAYNSEKGSGSYSIDVKLYLRVRFRLRGVKTVKFKPKINCDLNVPLDSSGKASGSFQTTRCGLDW